MLKRIFMIFKRDLKVNLRDFLTIYIIIAPAILSLGINFFAPGINDTTVNIGVLNTIEDEEMAFYEDVANVEVFEDEKALENRVLMRDHVIGINGSSGNYDLLTQGNEPESVVELTKLIKTLYDIDASLEETNTTLNDFGMTTPPIKKVLVNIALLMTSVLGGMLIAINIVEEKMTKTYKAIDVAPVTRMEFIFGKSIIGAFVPFVGSILVILITGYTGINILQMLLMVVSVSLISILVGFIEGLSSEDMMDAVASVKMLFIPVFASIAVIEFLSEKWQPIVYWNPFYWSYKGIDQILSDNASWSTILMYTGVIIAICTIAITLLRKKINEGLS